MRRTARGPQLIPVWSRILLLPEVSWGILLQKKWGALKKGEKCRDGIADPFYNAQKWIFLIPPLLFPSSIADGVCVFKCLLNRDTECCRVGKESVLITLGYNSILLKFESPAGKFGACPDPFLAFPEDKSPDWLALLLLAGWRLAACFLLWPVMASEKDLTLVLALTWSHGWGSTSLFLDWEDVFILKRPLPLWSSFLQSCRRGRPPRWSQPSITLVASPWRWGCSQKRDFSIWVAFRMIPSCFFTFESLVVHF